MEENKKDPSVERGRDIKKRYERMGKLKADVGAAPLAYTVIVYAFAVIAVFGLMFGVINLRSDLGKIALAVAGVSGALLVIMFFVASRKGPTRYTEVAIRYAGKQLLFQIIDDRHVIFTNGEYTLEYFKKKVTERPQGILNPLLTFNAPLAATYGETTFKGGKTVYVGALKSEDGKKPHVYKVSCEGKFVTGFKMDGKSVNFDAINQKGVSLGLPALLIEAIQERGTLLPPKDIAVSNK